MVRIIMSGCNGHMGQVISGLVKEDPEAEIVAGIDLVHNRENGYPVFTDMDACDIEADALIFLLRRLQTKYWNIVDPKNCRWFFVRQVCLKNRSGKFLKQQSIQQCFALQICPLESIH